MLCWTEESSERERRERRGGRGRGRGRGREQGGGRMGDEPPRASLLLPPRLRPPPPLLLLLRLLLVVSVTSSIPSRAAEEVSPQQLADSGEARRSNSTKGLVQFPAVSLSLSLGISQELNPNPFIHPNPMLSLSLSLSVSEELRGNPFDILDLPSLLLPQSGAGEERPGRRQQPPGRRQEQRLGQRLPIKESAASRLQGMKKERGANCAYTVSIKTSCSSPRLTRDAVSLAFGDAYRHEVYVARLDDPAAATFSRCSVDTFRVFGPCGKRTCYLYLRRSGRDGWNPGHVKIFYNLIGDARAAVTFPYEAPLPDGIWYGFNACHDGGANADGGAVLLATLPEPAAPIPSAGSDGERDDDGGEEGGGGGPGGDGEDDGGSGDPTIKLKTKVAGSVKTVILKI